MSANSTTHIQVCIVIPCYNECNRLPQNELLVFAAQHSDYKLLLVDDGSTDETATLIQHLSKQATNIDQLILPQNGGKAEAVRQGILYAHKKWIDCRYIGFMDADLATPLYEMIFFTKVFLENPNIKIVTGCRLKRLGAQVERNVSRHIAGRFFATFTNWILPLNMYDTQCGAKLIAADVVEPIFSKPFITKWIFDIEMFVRLHQNLGYSAAQAAIFEYPLHKWQDVAGSKLGVKAFFISVWQIFRIKNHYGKFKY
ncbi:MAG: glycosyltransferase [Saprospiraceae bacterium]|nr:glycosyltransferase [Saprospiraceae bacterium]MBP7699282.1 glycosyltransferase [Saprospiraceae bacterium]